MSDLLRRYDRLTFGARHDEREQPVRVAIALLVAAVATVCALYVDPAVGPAALLFVVAGGVLVALIFGSPLFALTLLMVASFLRQALTGSGLPAEPMVLVLCATFVALVIAGLRGSVTFQLGALELAMGAYLLWNVISMIAPHEFPALESRPRAPISVYRFILTGTLLPFVGFVIGRAVLNDERRIRRFMLALVIPAAYSAIVSILQFTGPPDVVWPQYIVTDPNYPERAVGVFNQPVVNGLMMVAGFVTALFLAQTRGIGLSRRLLLFAAAVLCLPGIYLTKTRAVWLVFGVGVLVCALAARGARRGFVVTLVGAVVMIGLNWATFTSSDRKSGGIGSEGEVDDRLNSMATSFWAIKQKPFFGWGIGRYAEVNTYYHKQWSPSIDYRRGYAISSHENELGIAAELGLVGLALWLLVLALLITALVRAFRRLPATGLSGRPLALIALTVLGTWFVCGFTVDLRYFDFPNLLTFVLIGAVAGVTDRLRKGDKAPSGRNLVEVTE